VPAMDTLPLPPDEGTMAETTKLSVEKALNKLRKDSPKSKSEQHDEKMQALEAEIKRMKAETLRLQRKGPKLD